MFYFAHGKKRQNFYIPLTFTLVQDWNTCDLFAQAQAESTFYTCSCKGSHCHTAGFKMLTLSGSSLHPAKEETEISPLNSQPVTNTGEHLGDLVLKGHCKIFSIA